MSVAAIGIGALFGAGVAAATGGDPLRGAMFGAVTGGVFGQYAAASPAVAPSAEFGASVVGGAKGGALGGLGSSIIKGPSGGQVLQTPSIPTPGPTQVSIGYASEAERQKRQRRRGYGSTILAGGELGVASTTRKQILG